MEIRPLDGTDESGLRAFFDAIPDDDRNFFKADLANPAILARWLDDSSGARLVACEGDDLIGIAAIWPGIGRSSHVGELRLVVAPDRRREGVGQELARSAIRAAVPRGMTKISVEVAAGQQGTIDMFRRTGFEPEALLRDQLRDADGELHDVVVLAHLVEENWEDMLTVGLDGAAE